MRKVKSKNTNIEILLRKELYKRGLRFKIKSFLFGKPDIILPKEKIVIFCDGDFWHGKNYEKEKINYKDFWVKKIESNITRDRLVNKTLKKEGWKVLRFWKTDILKNVKKCADKIEQIILSSKRNS